VVEAPEAIYSFNTVSANGTCVVLYTQGNSDLHLYECATGESRTVGDAFGVALSCGDSGCVYASGTRIEKLDLAAVRSDE
jgi:hypothetical protein